MSKTRDTGFLNNVIKTDSQGNVTIVSGSTNLLSISSSGAITTTGVISGSNALSASFALTASSADNFVVRQNVTASNVLSTGNITAQTLVVQTVTSSITYSSGSNIFGNQLTNVQQFTGSLRVTGSGNHFIQGGSVGIGTSSPTRLVDISGSAGVLRVQNAGSVGAPSIELGVQNQGSGLFAPAANTIAITTNDTERLRITSGGNFQVTGSAFFSTTAAFAGRVTAGGSMLLGEVQSSYSLLETTAGNGIWLRPVGIASPGGLFVSGSGAVGIGTSTPQSTLSVVGRSSITDSAQVPLTLNNTGQRYTQLDFHNNGVQKGSIWADNTDSSFNIYSVSGWSQIFSAGATERLRITSGGNLILRNPYSITNLSSTATTTLISGLPTGTSLLISVTIQWTSNSAAQRTYLLHVGATTTAWGSPNSGITTLSSLDWSSGYVGAATFAVGGSGSDRTLTVSVANANVYSVNVYASIFQFG